LNNGTKIPEPGTPGTIDPRLFPIGPCRTSLPSVSAGRVLLLECTIAGAGSDFGVVAAGGGAIPIDGAAAGPLVEEDAVAAGPAGQGEDFASGIEMVDHPGFFQSPGDLPGRFLQIEGIDQFHTDQVFEIHFNGQAAARGAAVVAEIFSIFDPGRRMVDMARLC
jgi:hypothetical protein